MPHLEPKILLVDDYEPGRVATRAALEQHGFCVTEAATGLEALERAQRKPDLVVLDVNLPDIDGFEVCRRLKLDPKTAHIPVLHLSAARSDPSSRAHGLEQGADGFLVQPVEPRVLAATIHSTLRARAAARAASREKELLRLVLDTLPVAVWIVDAKGRVTDSNPAGAALLGRPPLGVRPQAVVQAFRRGVPMTDDEWPLARALDGGGETNDEVMDLRDQHGRDKTVVQLAAPIRAGDGRATGAVVVCRDITDQRSAERRLVAAQRMEAVGVMAGGIAHEFNNALTVVMAHAHELATALGLSPDERDGAKAILQAAEGAARLTRQIQAYGRKQTLRPERVDVSEQVRQLAPLLTKLIGERSQLVLDLDADAGHARVDRTELERVVVNLVLNARDALEEPGTIRVSTSRAQVDEKTHGWAPGNTKGQHLVIAVHDDGAGMPPAVLDRMFEPFFTTKGVGEGTGLGLSMVQGFVHQSGGFVTAESVVGEGTTLRIFLPSVDGAAEMARPSAVSPVPVVEVARAVLLVDDDERIRRVITRVLTRHGYRVLTASNGQEALELVEREGLRFDVLLTDVIMPGRTGPQIARELAARGKDFVTVFMSGYAADVLQEHGPMPERSHWLDKPFDVRSFLERMEQAFGGKPAAARSNGAAARG